jgi:hypothetical protein
MFSPSGIASEISVVASTLEGFIPALSSVGASASTISMVTEAVSGIQASAQALATADSGASAQSTVQRVIADVNAVTTALDALPLPSEISVPLRIVSFVIPAISAAASLIFPAAPAATAPAPAAA